MFRSLRQRLYAIAICYLVLLLGLAAYSVYNVRQSAYLLERAGKSYAQLGLLHRLDSEMHHHFTRQLEALTRGEPADNLTVSNAQIDHYFSELRRLTETELAFINPDERDDESDELPRLADIYSGLNDLLARALATYQQVPRSERASTLLFFTQQMLENFQQRLQPLMNRALSDEQDEVQATEGRMQALRQQLDDVIGFGLALTVLATLVLAYTVSRSLLRPVAALTQATDALAQGHLETRLPPLDSSEFTQLRQHFNAMADQLQQHRQHLQTLNHELEQRVAERTASLQTSNARLQQVDANRRRFLEDVSHELRSPLTILQGEADVALRDPSADAASYREALVSVQAQAGFLRRRIEDLMALTRAEDGCLPLHYALVDMCVLVEQTVQTVAPLARINQLSIDCELPDTAMTLQGDAGWLRQLLLTLLDNAVKFSHPHGTVWVRLQLIEQTLQLSVWDAGRGVAAADLPHLFERYYQAATPQAGRGFGLGLAIARWIVEQHCGTITAVPCAHLPDKPQGATGLCIVARFPVKE